MHIPYQCSTTYCPLQCCDQNGMCPANRASCYYYYDQQYINLSTGVIVAIVLGSICGITIFAMIICYFCKRSRQNTQIQPQSPRRNSGALPNQNDMVFFQRNSASYGTSSFNDLFMAENRNLHNQIPISDPPSRDLPPPYFQRNIQQTNINPYYSS